MAKLTQTKAFKKLLEIGSERGYVTTDEVDRLFPAGSIKKEKLEVLFDWLKEKHQIEVLRDHKKPAQTEAEQERAALRKTPTRVDSASDALKTNDPVRMYLRKMGSVSLLTRDGEIEIAKRIEEGELEVMDVLLDTNFTVEQVLAYEVLVREAEINVRDLVKDLEGEDGSGDIADERLIAAVLDSFTRARQNHAGKLKIEAKIDALSTNDPSQPDLLAKKEAKVATMKLAF
ncbi:MAG: sigma-70 factor domain-containing protein, partial [Myxococcota bacterium]|nr:sigma-70 factor domain-containing protein [Myxococcota bacterium]